MPRLRVFFLDEKLERKPLQLRFEQAGGRLQVGFPTEHAMKRHRAHAHRLMHDLTEIEVDDWFAVVAVEQGKQVVVDTDLDAVCTRRLQRRLANHFQHQSASLWRERGRTGSVVSLPLPPDPEPHVISNFIARVRQHVQQVPD